MAVTSTSPRLRCRSCGCELAADNHGSDCSPCRRAHRDYDPRHDPRFADQLLALLTTNRRRPVHVYRALGIEHCGVAAWRCVANHIERFRRQGYVIVGRHDGTYEYQRRVRP